MVQNSNFRLGRTSRHTTTASIAELIKSLLSQGFVETAPVKCQCNEMLDPWTTPEICLAPEPSCTTCVLDLTHSNTTQDTLHYAVDSSRFRIMVAVHENPIPTGDTMYALNVSSSGMILPQAECGDMPASDMSYVTSR